MDPRSVVPCCLNCVKSRELHSESERLNIEGKKYKKFRKKKYKEFRQTQSQTPQWVWLRQTSPCDGQINICIKVPKFP